MSSRRTLSASTPTASSLPCAAGAAAPGRTGSWRCPTPATSRRRSTSGATPWSALPWRGGPPATDHDPLFLHLERQFRALHRRLDTLERHCADLMFLVLSAQDLLLDRRRDFSERSRAAIAEVTAAEPFDGRCPCCGDGRVLAESGRPLPGAEFDHFFHRGLNRPEHG